MRVFFDLETSGLDPKRDSIIQIAAACPETGATFEKKVKFDVSKASQKALEVNSYDEEIWKQEAIEPALAAGCFSAFMKRHASVKKTSKRTGRPYNVAQLVAYNGAAFDGPWIREWYGKMGIFLPADFKILDPLQLAMWMYPGLPNHKLETVAKHFGVYRENAHDALVDVHMMVDVTKTMENVLKEAGVYG